MWNSFNFLEQICEATCQWVSGEKKKYSGSTCHHPSLSSLLILKYSILPVFSLVALAVSQATCSSSIPAVRAVVALECVDEHGLGVHILTASSRSR